MHSTTAAPVQLAAAASVVLQPVLEGPSRRGKLLGVSQHAAWIDVDGEIIVVSDQEAVRLPNALELGIFRLDRWIHAADHVAMGEERLKIGHLEIVPRRWFDPRPVLRSTTFEELAVPLQELADRTGQQAQPALAAALRSSDRKALHAAMVPLLGLGEGLTPEGDDLVAGALAAYVLLGTAAGRSIDWVKLELASIDEMAGERTTGFSAALIVHAVQGRVAQPFAAVLRGLTGAEGLTAAAERLMSVGHSSGPALVKGILTAGSALSQEYAYA